MNGICINDVTKNFHEVQALKNVNITFEENKIYGLLGRNGAGKSTLLNIVSGRLFPTSGEVRIDDLKAAENDKAQGKIYLMSESNYYNEMVKISNVFRITKSFYGSFDTLLATRMAKAFGLDTEKRLKSLSTGFKSIYKFIAALCSPAKYILLDEPVLGLDANHRELFYKFLLENYSNNPRTIVISTHIIEEVTNIIEDVIILKNGSVISSGTCEALLRTGYRVSGTATDIDSFCTNRNIIGIDTIGGLKTAYVNEPLSKAEIPPYLEVSMLNLQELFVKLTDERVQL